MALRTFGSREADAHDGFAFAIMLDDDILDQSADQGAAFAIDRLVLAAAGPVSERLLGRARALGYRWDHLRNGLIRHGAEPYRR
jgi:hypothetical protein